MKKSLIIFLIFACLFLSGCEGVTEQVAQIPGVSEEMISLAESMSSDSNPLDPAVILEALGVSMDGTGTAEDPYLIYQTLDLFVLHLGPAALNKHYKLMNDIYLPEVLEGESNWTPAGSVDEPFTGTFDGNGKKIEGLRIYLSEHDEDLYSISLGLFGEISGEETVIKDLFLTDFEIIVSESVKTSVTVGSISGWLMQHATIENCSVSGSLTILNEHSKNVGGIVGYSNLGNILNCSASVKISTFKASLDISTVAGRDYIGGIVGYSAGMISKCYAKVSIKAPNRGYSGGIAGANYREISTSYTVGSIQGSKWAGGIVGSNYGTNFFPVNVNNCFSSIDINSFIDGGGIVGNNYDSTITTCYALGKIAAGENGGGIAGRIVESISGEALIESCFAVQKSVEGGKTVGRIVGSYDSGALTNNSAWIGINVTKNGAQSDIFENKNYIDGATVWVDDLSTINIYKDAGWSTDEDHSTWIINDSFLLPVLNDINIDWIVSYNISYLNSANEKIFIPFESLKGSGTESDPYLIFTLVDLNKLSEYPEYFSGSHYKLVNDIVFDKVGYNESNWTPLGTEKTPFKGIFDGNNKTISGLVIYNETDMTALGLFAYVDKSSKIYNLNLADIKISYNPNIEAVVGGIAAYNEGVIENCSTSGKMAPATLVIPDLERLSEDEELLESYWSLTSCAGGIVGINSGTVSKSYSSVDMTVTASGEFGGIAATNYNSIGKCHSSGSITHLFFNDPAHAFMTYAGGIAGYNSSTISDCYSTMLINSQGVVGGIAGYNYFPEIQSSADGLSEYHFFPTTDGGFQMFVVSGDASNYKKSTVISNCYALNESLKGSYFCGGIVGYNSGIIHSCVALPESVESFMYLGLVVGFSDSYEDMTNNYTSNGFGSDPSDPDTTTKKITLSRLKQKSFYQSLGWDFSGTWDMKTGYGFPILKGVGGQENITTPLTYR